jgi:hypothetical protein
MVTDAIRVQKPLPGPDYKVTVTFDAPLRFAYDWCTDFTSDDPRLEREPYERRILKRSPRRVLYEDLEREDDGWHWARYDVTLRPPNRWHLESVGNYRSLVADYRLTPRPGDGTEFHLAYRRRSGPLPSRPLSKAAREKSLARTWRRFKAELERDYRASPRRR